MARPDHELGEEVSLSAGKSAVQIFIGSVAGVAGGSLGLWFAVHVITTPNNGDMPRWLVVALGWLCALFSLLIVAAGVFALGREARLARQGARLFVGATQLTCVARDGEVLVRVPYDNIEDVRFLEDEGGHNGPPDDKVAITLIDPRREDTILRAGSPLEPDLDEGHVVLRDRYRVSPRRLHGMLVEGWRRGRRAEREGR